MQLITLKLITPTSHWIHHYLGMTLIKIESKSGSGVKALSDIVLFMDKYQGNVIIDNESNSRLY